MVYEQGTFFVKNGIETTKPGRSLPVWTLLSNIVDGQERMSYWDHSLLWRTIIFWRGGGKWKFFTYKYFFHMYVAPAANDFFVSPSSCKHFFSCIFFLCLQPLQTIYFKIFQAPPPPPTPVKKIMVGPLERCIPLNFCNRTVFELWINHKTRTFS